MSISMTTSTQPQQQSRGNGWMDAPFKEGLLVDRYTLAHESITPVYRIFARQMHVPLVLLTMLLPKIKTANISVLLPQVHI